MSSNANAPFKTIIVASLGGALEFFDFAIYGLFAHYLSHVFFPSDDPVVSLMATFGVFAIGYLARPFGGIIFSHYGDRNGRKLAFQASVFLMTIATFLTGCLPSYATAGILAPLLLIALRILQSISVGGEIPGAAIFAIENVRGQRGFAVGLLFMGITFGTVLAGGLAYVLSTNLTEAQMISWGWRIAFFLGSVLGLVGVWLRRYFVETPVFVEFQRRQLIHKLPLLTALKSFPPRIFMGLGIMFLAGAAGFLMYYLPTYTVDILHYKIQQAYIMNVYSFALLAILTACFGYISDVVGRMPLLLLGCITTIFSGFYLFHALEAHDIEHIIFASTLFIITFAMVNGTCVCLLVELFPANIRYSGTAICYNLGFGVFVGIAPFVSTLLIKITGDVIAPYYYLLVAAIVTFAAGFYARDAYKTTLYMEQKMLKLNKSVSLDSHLRGNDVE